MPTLTTTQQDRGGRAATQVTHSQKVISKPHLSHDCFLWCETSNHPLVFGPPQGPITINYVLAHCSCPFYLIVPFIICICCSIRPGRTPLYLCLWVCVCVWCQHSGEHTLWTDTDWLWRNSSRLRLLRGGEGNRRKINKMSLGFVLFLFQNKQSNGRKNCRSFRSCWVLYCWFEQNHLDWESTTCLLPQ